MSDGPVDVIEASDPEMPAVEPEGPDEALVDHAPDLVVPFVDEPQP